jgi:hypothetical protein
MSYVKRLPARRIPPWAPVVVGSGFLDATNRARADRQRVVFFSTGLIESADLLIASLFRAARQDAARGTLPAHFGQYHRPQPFRAASSGDRNAERGRFRALSRLQPIDWNLRSAATVAMTGMSLAA